MCLFCKLHGGALIATANKTEQFGRRYRQIGLVLNEWQAGGDQRLDLVFVLRAGGGAFGKELDPA